MKIVYAEDVLDLMYVRCMGQDKHFIEAMEQVVDDCPAIDAKEEIHAHWKFNKDKTFKYCSHCGAGERTFYGTSPAVIGNYCEYCGATMDEVINDEDTGK